MIDIHSHIIFGVDDGAKDIEETKKILIDSYNQGVETIILTPHRRKNMFETPNSVINKHFEKVKAIAKEVAEDLNVYLGSEIYYTYDVLEKLESGEYVTLAGSNYVLIEFRYSISYNELYTAISNILLLGFTPVIAHIERYKCLYNGKDRVKELVDSGCFVQVNAESVLKSKLFGDNLRTYKKRVKKLLRENLVHFIASDVHNTSSRKCYMSLAYETISRNYGEDRARKLFVENQLKILEGVIK